MSSAVKCGHRRFCQRLGELGLGQVLDIVPNHMAISAGNPYWWDVLENGESSRYATWFDIDWHPAEVKLQNKILIPVLGDQYGRILNAGQIKVNQVGEQFCARYADHQFPLAPESLSLLLSKAANRARNDTLSFIADSFSRLPTSPDPGIALARHRDKTVIYGLLKTLCSEHGEVCAAIAAELDDLNHDIDALDDLLNRQNYRLAYWRTADQELGYRRFFDVNTLIGLRVGREHVFEATHSKILEWLRVQPARWRARGPCRRPARSAAVLRDGCARARPRPGSSARRFWRRASSCAKSGRSTAPAATTS